MNTREKRMKFVQEVLNDPDVAPSFTEAVKYIYYWMRFELAKDKRMRAHRQVEYYLDKLDDELEVFNLRKEMKDL